MMVTALDLHNTLFEGNPENQKLLADLSDLFPEAQIVKKNVDALPNLVELAKKAGGSQQDLLLLVHLFIEREQGRPLPAIERLPLYFYKEGIHSVKSKLLLRQRVAWEHFNGNTAYNLFTAIQDLIQGK